MISKFLIINCLLIGISSLFIEKNWLNTCNSVLCNNEITYCIEQNCMFDTCAACLKQKGPLCSPCANDIFDVQYQLFVNGNFYLQCDRTNPFHLNICQFFCQGKGSSNSECTSNLCVCGNGIGITFGNFSGSLSHTITGNNLAKSIDSRKGYSEFAVGFGNASINIYNNFGQFIRTFLVDRTMAHGLLYLSNGDIASTGGYGTKIHNNDGSFKKLVTQNPGNVLALFRNGDIAYNSYNTIYIWNPKDVSYRIALYGHTSIITALLTLPNGDLVSGSADNNIKVWNPIDGVVKKTLYGHTDSIRGLALLENSNIASVADDKTIKIWNVNTGVLVKNIVTDHSGIISSIVLLPSNRLATGSFDSSIKIWDKEQGKLIGTLSGYHRDTINAMSLNSDNILVSVSDDGKINLWN